MNCEQYQDVLSDFIDGSLAPEDHNSVAAHLSVCGDCAAARNDVGAIVGFYHEHRGEYDAVPNERALWLRISNMIEMESPDRSRTAIPANAGWWFRLMNRSWQLSFPQLAAAAVAIIIVVSIFTVVGLRGLNFNGSGVRTAGLTLPSTDGAVKERFRQQQQVIAYWNERVELNKARWNPQMRETFDKNMSVIDTAVNDSMRQLTQNPHDEVSEEILNAALNDKVELLREFAAL
ncbi:MAG TPA: zf-HC2 domain-containing protein [Pyrinomonadaceae bacterium]|nr:zf-HC2 domain-containing protein [Pyrinomonadaceae bacterium]